MVKAVGALLGAAGGGAHGRLKSFHPLLALPCGHVHELEKKRRKKGSRWWIRTRVRIKTRGERN